MRNGTFAESHLIQSVQDKDLRNREEHRTLTMNSPTASGRNIENLSLSPSKVRLDGAGAKQNKEGRKLKKKKNGERRGEDGVGHHRQQPKLVINTFNT